MKEWRQYVSLDKGYHIFKSFKVYNAFMWRQAEEVERNITEEFKSGKTVHRRKIKKIGLYSNRYKNTCNT